MAIYNSIVELIGNTPLLKLNKLQEHLGLKANIYAKLEMFNPAGSIKDRVAHSLIMQGFEKGTINSETTIIEPTSGNTGIGLALVARSLGLKLILTMPDSMTQERISLLKARGAKLVLTPAAKGMAGAVEEAQRLQKETPNSVIMDQFGNPDNLLAHIQTASEIHQDLINTSIDYFIAGVGTGGTVSGVAKYLKQQRPNLKAIAVEPKESALITTGKAGPHKIQGIGANFIPGNYISNVIDSVMPISGDDAINTAAMLNKVEAVLAGISAGANIAAAIELAKDPNNEGKNIVTVLPDTGEHYLSLDIFS